MNYINIYTQRFENFELRIVANPTDNWLKSISSDSDDGIVAVVSPDKYEVERLQELTKNNTWVYHFFVDENTPSEKMIQQLTSYFYKVDQKMTESEIRFI